MQYKRKIKKYLFALVMLIASAFATVFIKDTVDSLNPEKSLPEISVSVGYNPPYVVRAGYTWRFGFKTVRSPYVPATDAPMTITECHPGEVIVINFSEPEEYVNLYQATGVANEEFTQMYNWTTPMEEGIYVYHVNANFEKGDISYYFTIQVKKANVMS